ncbi:MAG: cytochrome c oxidase subunit I [Phycisphaerales bacterium]|nr:cytochrome c oxidase subunit I [Phycisphaerales bacterium]MDG1977444.1 cytochrome c oxidase subunit I [Phycisphaerales bacterium]MDG2132024.1 cytochrome c oxidase subunit I [Phycisphaerales bacterium]
MTTLDATSPNPSNTPAPPVDNYLTYTRGFLSWALTLDHKRIGLMYLVAVLGSFLVGGIFALLVRTELLTPGATIPGVDAEVYNQFFTLHGAIMVFLVIIPSIPAALGNFVLPIMLGAKDVAFPRLNLGSFYLWIIGAVLAVVSLAYGGFDTGWTFYTPYSTTTTTGGVIPVVTGVFILGFSSIFTGLNFVVTIHKLRPPGMTWFRMPLLLWALYATALIQVLATPVLGITLLMLIVERVFQIGLFDPAMGGDPVLFQHFFWFYSHPAVYIMILPAMGIISEIISVHAHRHIFGYRFIAFSSVAIAIFSFLVWGHHMFTSGQSPLMNVVFSLITFSVAIPSAIKVFNWMATLYRGSISINTPMLYGLGFIFLFTIGGLTGLHLGTLNTDIHLHDTYFVVAHFHYVMMGSALIAMIGGLHHWWPKMVGRMYNEKWGIIGFSLVFIGFNVTFFTQFMLGSHGMPRRYYNYQPEFQIYHVISTIGSYIMAAGFFWTLFYLLQSLFSGVKAPSNPWGGRSLEWQCTSPPPHDNFKTTPSVGDCYDFSVVKWDEEEGGYVVDRSEVDEERPDH